MLNIKGIILLIQIFLFVKSEKTMTTLEIGRGQMKVMRVLWEKKRATAQEITDILNETDPIKFSTVSTFLRTLVRKEAIAYDIEKRTFIYYPLINEEHVANHALQDLIDHIFAGSIEGFASFVIKNKYIPQDELNKVWKLINKKD